MPDRRTPGRRTAGGREPRAERPVALGEIVDELMRREVFSRGVPVAELASRWPAIVGERLASETAPVALDEGLLTVGASTGPWGAQATFLQEQIRRNADEALGGDAVRAIRIIVRNRS
jgi:predicted nucleic acid-binding Zn ribbon protein